MLEEQQVLIEDAARFGRRRLSNALSGTLGRLRQFAFWMLPPLDARGGLRTAGDLYSAPQFFASFRDMRNRMFHETAEHRYELVAAEGDAQAAALLEENFVERRFRPESLRDDRIFAGAYSIDNLMSDIIAPLVFMEGEAFLRLRFVEDGERHYVRLQRLNEQGFKRVWLPRRRGQYRHVVRPSVLDRPPKVRVEYIPEDEVARFVHPRGKAHARKTIQEAHRIAREDDALHSETLAFAYAAAAKDDKRFWVERARWMSISPRTARMNELGWEMGRLFGGIGLMELIYTDTTEFYKVHANMAGRLWLAEFRESIIQQFNRQVSRRLLARNGFDVDAARLVPAGDKLRSADEWREALGRLKDGTLTIEDAQQMLYPQLKESAASAAEGVSST